VRIRGSSRTERLALLGVELSGVRPTMRRMRSEGGFTLIELLVTMAILLVVVGALTGALVSATHTEADLNNRYQTQSQARLAMSKLVKEVHCASAITDTSSPAVSLTSWTGAKSAVALTLPSSCSTGSGTVYWCASASGSAWNLYRQTAWTGSCSGGVRWAYGLRSGTPFSLPSGIANLPTTAHYPLLHITLAVNALSSGASGAYQLTDDIAALNAVRS
jgi:prepilin-type N-terminal cleavage/methylation domain-containing protein